MTSDYEVDPSLRTKCLDLCQALVDKGTPFTFSLTIGSTFTLSLDTRKTEESPIPQARKKSSPSTLRRNARRKDQFLKRKAETPETLKEKPDVQGNWRSEVVQVSDKRAVKLKLVKKPSKNIDQLDGHEEEVTAEAATQTVKAETKDTAVQTTKSAPVLDICAVQQTNLPWLPEQPSQTNMGPYRPPRTNMAPKAHHTGVSPVNTVMLKLKQKRNCLTVMNLILKTINYYYSRARCQCWI